MKNNPDFDLQHALDILFEHKTYGLCEELQFLTESIIVRRNNKSEIGTQTDDLNFKKKPRIETQSLKIERAGLLIDSDKKESGLLSKVIEEQVALQLKL